MESIYAPRRGANLTYLLSAGLGVATILATVPTLFVPGVLRGPAVMNGSARGTALVALFVALPILGAAMAAAARGWDRAPILWLGAAGYLLYNAFLFLFATPFNQLFLAYLAMLAFAGWTLAAVLQQTDVPHLGARLRAAVPARAVAAFTWLVVALNVLAWMARVVPDVLSTQTAALLEGTGLTTSPLYIQDLGIWLPLVAVAAWWLWLGRDRGYLVVGAVLVMAADPASTVASAAMTPAFAAVAAITLIPASFFFRRGPSGRWLGDQQMRAVRSIDQADHQPQTSPAQRDAVLEPFRTL